MTWARKSAHVIFKELRGPPEYHFNGLQVPTAALKEGVGEDPKGALDGILKSEIGFWKSPMGAKSPFSNC